MNIPFTLGLSLTAALVGSICRKYYTDAHPAGWAGGFVFNAVGSLTAALLLLCWGGFGPSSAFTLWLGVAFGAVTALQGITNIAALQCGPLAYTSVIISFSVLISALSGAAFFGERLGWMQIVGILLMLASFVFAARSNAEDKRANLKWFLLCLVAFAATGGIGIMQKVHQSSAHRDELNAFLVTAFVTAAVLCALLAVWLKKREGPSADTNGAAGTRRWLMLGIMLVNGACVTANNKFNLYLSGVLDSAVFFPIVNVGGLVLTTLAAVLLFREKLTKKQWLGIVFGIASVVCIGQPIA